MNLPNIETFKEHTLMIFNKQQLPPNITGSRKLFNIDNSLSMLEYKDVSNNVDLVINYFSSYVILSSILEQENFITLFNEILYYTSLSTEEKFQLHLVMTKEKIFTIEMHLFMKQHTLILEY